MLKAEGEIMTGYQDYVIKDGRLVGDFEGLYQDFDDPWHQSREHHLNDTRRQVAVDWCKRLRAQSSKHAPLVSRVLEVGCGFGFLTNTLSSQGFSSIGVDVAHEAVRLAREKNPGDVFLARGLEDETMLGDLDPDVVIMAEVTWYVLENLGEFVQRLRDFAAGRDRPTYLIHLLTTYAPGTQQYGTDFFTDLDGILAYFDLEYLETGSVLTPREDDPLSRGTYFVAKVPA